MAPAEGWTPESDSFCSPKSPVIKGALGRPLPKCPKASKPRHLHTPSEVSLPGGQQCFSELLRCQKELAGSLEVGFVPVLSGFRSCSVFLV